MKQRNARWPSHLQYPETSAGRISILPADVFKAIMTVGGCPPIAWATLRMSHPTIATQLCQFKLTKLPQIESFPCTTKDHHSSSSFKKHRAITPDVFLYHDDRNGVPQAFQEGGRNERL